jgi:hypothetical protein
MAKNVFKILGLLMGPHFTVTGDFNLNMMLKMEVKKIKMAYGLTKDIKDFYMHVITSYKSPTNIYMYRSQG